jgi:hypothetical protein
LADWFPNLITNGGLDRIGTNADYLSYCHVGAGNTTPAFTDTGLASWLAQTASKIGSTSIQGSSPYYSTQQYVYFFDIGVAAGNLAEVGVGWSNSNTDLYSRALILDSGGSPTTITVLSDEYLYVTYQMRRYIPEIDTSSVVNISGIDYTFTGRAAVCTNIGFWPPYFRAGEPLGGQNNVYTYSSSIGDITSSPSNSSGKPIVNPPYNAYVLGNYYRDCVWEFGLTQGNAVGGITAFYSNKLNNGAFQFGVSPAIPKTADNILEITVRSSWSRH